MTTLPTLRTTFTRHHLLLARLGWLLIALLVLSLLVANLPYQVTEVQISWQVGEAWPFARNLFATQEAFARWLVFWRIGAGMFFFGTAVFLLFRTLFALGLLGLGLTMWLEKSAHLQSR